MIIFTNPGVIDERVITTFGVNVKTNDNPIGHFGTGLKYAIAVILRHDLSITIFAGNLALEFKAVTNEIRGKEFDIVEMNGKPMPFTTELGKDWELWEAFRELYSNCMDEGGEIDQVDEAVGSTPDTTAVIVKGEEFEDLYDDLGEMFIADADDALLCTVHGDVYERPSETLFYRGIRVNKYKKPYKYLYNIKETMELTENRTFKYSFYVDRAICNIVARSTDETFIYDVITAGKDYAEHHLNFEYTTADPSEQFKTVMARVRWEKAKHNGSASTFYSSSCSFLERVLKYVLSVRQQKVFNTKLNRLRDYTGFEFDDLEIVETLGDDFVGVEDDILYVSKSLLEEDDATMFEHLIQGELDKWDEDEGEQRNALLNMLAKKI